MGYTDVFGGNTIYPSDVSFLRVDLVEDITFAWPLESAAPEWPLARIIDVMATAPVLPNPGWAMTLPDATEAAPGQTVLFNNLAGSQVCFIKDNSGATIATLGVGEQWELYLVDNLTPAGLWRVFNFGASTATVQPSALAGYGLTVTGATLSQSIPVNTFGASPITLLDSSRAAAFVWTGSGSAVVNLPGVGAVGNNWFTSVRNAGGGDVTVDPLGGETIDGAATLRLSPGEGVLIITDGLQWFTLGLGQAAVFAFDFTVIDLTGSGPTYTLTGSELNRVAYKFIGALTTNVTVIVPSTVQQYWVDNSTTGAFTLSLSTLGGTPVNITQGARAIFYSDGTEIVDADTGGIPLPLTVPAGGTGITSYTIGDMLYAAAPTVLAKLADVPVGNVLNAGGVGLPPFYGPVNLATSVIGVLPPANGGSGVGVPLTPGSVVFAGPGGVLAEDNAQFFWNDATNRLGIGTVVPGVKMEVAGNIRSTNVDQTNTAVVELHAEAAGVNGGHLEVGFLGGGAYGPLAFRTGGFERMRVDAAGDLSVGTTAALQPAAGRANFSLNGVTDAVISFGNAGATAGYIHAAATALNLNAQAGRDITFNLGGERMRILGANGNVGIGTTGPVSKLHVSEVAGSSTGGVQMVCQSQQGGFGAGISFRSPLLTSGALMEMARVVADGDNAWDSGNVSSQDARLSFWTTGDGVAAERMRITAAGNVGIGTTAPEYRLDVKAPGANCYIRTRADGAPAIGNVTGIVFETSNAFNNISTGSIVGVCSNAGNCQMDMAFSVSQLAVSSAIERMRLRFNGALGVGTVSPGARVHSLNLTPAAANWTQADALRLGEDTGSPIYYVQAGMYNGAGGWVGSIQTIAGGVAAPFIISPGGGNVGIGVLVPGAALHVNGQVIAMAEECHRLQGASPYITFNNAAGSTRYGYFQHTGVGGSFLLNNDIAGGNIHLKTTGAGSIYVDHTFAPLATGTIPLGGPSNAWSAVYAANNVIQPSDQRLKTPLAPLTPAELAAAKTIAQGIGSFHWLDTENQDDKAHIGVIAQAVIAALEAQGLDPLTYGFVHYDEWDAVEAESTPEIEAEVDAEGNVTREAIPPKEVAPARVAGNIYSIIYTELSMFIAAAQEQRLAALEALLP